MVPQDEHQPSNGWISTSRHLKTTGLLGYIHPCPNGICIDRLIIQKAMCQGSIFQSATSFGLKATDLRNAPPSNSQCICQLGVAFVYQSPARWQQPPEYQVRHLRASMKSWTPLDSSSTSCRQGVNGWFCNRLNCCWMYLKKASGVGNQEAFLSWKMLWKCFLLKIGWKDLQS